jgi:sulfite reductase (NADPH) flavoprotein alpha-component
LASFDALLARAEQQAPGWVLMMMRLPPRGDGPINVLIQEPTAPHIFARSQLQLDRTTAEVVKWEPYASASPGRKARIWVRGLHTGEALGLIGQTVAGLASFGGCFLVWTGVAMAWRRFRYRKRDAENASTPEYATVREKARPVETQNAQSNVVETPKEAEGVEMKQAHPTETNGHARNGYEDPRAEWSAAPYNGDSVLILYGTVTGTAETLANRLAAELRRDGVNTVVHDMAHCQPAVLTPANCVLLVVSTYGDGEPPEDAVHFWEAVVRGNGLDLRGVRYSVLALGNTTYDQFCKCGRDFDAALERHGASRIYPRVDCDVDYDLLAKHWFDGVVALLVRDGSRARSVAKKESP